MQGNNLQISISANTADLRANLAVANSAMRDFNRQLNTAARDARRTGDDLSMSKVQDAAAQFERQTAVVAGLRARMEEAARSGNSFSGSLGQTRYAAQNLGFQLNDIATSLASGGSPMRVLAQQGGQVVQVFQQGGGVRAVLSSFATSLRSVITPATTAAAGVAAAGVAVASLTARAIESTSAIRQFGVMLKGLDLEGQGTAGGLEVAAKRLRDVGLTAVDARAALREAVRANISPAQAERIVRTGQNLIPVLGDDAPKTFLNAIAGGVEPLGKLVVQLGLVSEREVAAAREAARFGQEVQYLDRWIGLIEARAKGLKREALSPLAQSMLDLRVAWNNALDALAKTDAIQGLLRWATQFATALDRISNWTPPSWLKAFDNLAIPGAVLNPGAAIGSAIGNAAIGGREQVVATAPIPPASSAGGGRAGDPRNKEAMVRYWASYYGHNPDTAVRVARSEGLGTYVGDKGTSFGAFQLHVGGGLGDEYRRETGRDPSNPANEDDMIRWSMANLNRTGWGPYHGAARVGIGSREGIEAGGSSFYARPDSPRGQFLGSREAEFPQMFEETRREAIADREVARAFRKGGLRGGAIAGASVRGTLETARRFGFDASSAEAQDQATRRSAQFVDALRASGERRFAEQTAEAQQTVAQLNLQVSLQGKGSEEIERQVSLLRARQQIEAAALPVTGQTAKDYLAATDAIGQANIRLAAAQRWAEPLRTAFSGMESSLTGAVGGLLTGRQTFGQAAVSVRESLTQSAVSLSSSLLSKVGGRLLDDQSGRGIGEVLADKLTNWLLGTTEKATEIGLLTTIAANTTIMAGAAAANTGTSAVSAAGSAGGLFSGISSAWKWLGLPALALFQQGGIVPSAAGGWALPNFPGATPALLHSREMVLPAPISEGIQAAIAGGGFGGGGGGKTYNTFHISTLSPKDAVDAVNKALRLGGGRLRF